MEKLKLIWKFVNSKAFLLLLSAMLTLGSAYLTEKWKQASQDADRWEDNYSVLVQKTDTLRDINGKLITRTQTLQMTIQELKRSKDAAVQEMLKELQNSKLRLAQVDQMLTVKQTYNKELQMEVLNRDTLIRVLQQPEALAAKAPEILVGKYEDEFTKADILFNQGQWKPKYNATNEAYGVLYHQRENIKWLFNLRLGQKNYWFDFKETNPNIKTDIKILSVERKKKD